MKKTKKKKEKKECKCVCGCKSECPKGCFWARKIFATIFWSVLVGGGVWGYSGGFSKPVVVEKQVPAMVMAVKEHKGAYTKTKKPMDEVYEGLVGMGIEPIRGVGVYYGDPKITAEEDLRSEVGSLIEGLSAEKLVEVREKFEVKEYEAMQAMVVEFPIKTMLSYMIGPMRVYPVIQEHWQDKGYAESEIGIEIYDIPRKTITYIMPIVTGSDPVSDPVSELGG